MSYILDALQRAEAERARGSVPTLHARPLAETATHNRWDRHQVLGIGAAIGVAVLGIAAAGWWAWPWVAAPALPTPAQPKSTATALLVQPTPPLPPKVKAATVAKPAKSPEPVRTASASAPASAAVAGPAPAPLLSELPEATRRQIPAMTISGAVYSDNPAQRLLLVNGLVLNQGGEVAPDLTVVEIHSNRSEFNFKGTRFRMAH